MPVRLPTPVGKPSSALRLAWVELRDFRNHEQTRLGDLPSGVVTVVGPNGEGKTNLLEGIAFLFLLGSPRTSSAEPIVRRGADASAYARGEVETEGGRVLVEVEIPGRGANRVLVNRSPVRRKRDLRRQVRAVFFGPDDLFVVIGDPGRRRGFLDEALRSLWPLKEGAVTAYERVLRQRNRLLKEHDGRGAPSGLDMWDEQLVRAGVELIRLRSKVAGLLGPPASREHARLAEYDLEVAYAPNVVGDELEESFVERLAARRSDELIRRTTLVGPHRDDLSLAVRDMGARALAGHREGGAGRGGGGATVRDGQQPCACGWAWQRRSKTRRESPPSSCSMIRFRRWTRRGRNGSANTCPSAVRCS